MVMLSSLLLLVLVLTNVAVLAVLLATLSRARAYISNLEATVEAFFSPKGDGQMSPFAEMIDKASAILATRVVTSAQAAIRGSAGGAAKAANAQNEAEAIAANPILGLLGGKLGKSPIAAMALSALGSQFFAPSTKAPETASNNGHAPKFKLGV